MRGEVIAMDGYILRNRQEQLTLPADAPDKLHRWEKNLRGVFNDD